ncbi:hypothetical protein F7725_024857 [Dissostichus mawsoni]|uniref:Transporter n=1 Tax=Dissostichus mawsoni TaxID=36200 RepID=A0A7J5XA02_DISMA|nr:hypothetical protein F7725_024857 [Dissostichus mawsoni]
MRLVLPNPGLDLRIPSYEDLDRMDKEEDDRPKWDNKAQYILTCVGFCIGLGNVWRFPYLCQSHGGGFVPECQQSSTVDYYFYRVTLNSTTSIADSGGINWPIVLCLLTAWTIVAICCIRGISTAGKAVYVTAILPYIVLGIFLIRGLTLKGAMSGLKFLFTPDVNELIKPSTWLDAGAQVFYAFGLGWGGLISFSSYNPVHNNCVQDAVILSVVTSLTSVYAAAVTYSIIGFRATEKYDTCISEQHHTSNYEEAFNSLNSSYPDIVLGLDIKTCDMQKLLSEGVEGTGLAFIVFTEAITKMPGSQIWSVLLFVMLFSLGLSTLFGNIEGVVVPLKDLNVFPKNWPHEVLTGLTCAIAFIICLLFAQNSGLYWVTLFDNFAGSVPLLTIGLFEMIAVVYIYGIDSSVAMKLVLPNPGLDHRMPSYEDLERMDKEEAGDRPKWDNKAQYILTCVGFCVGIGNVWRFPYLCQSHGGGAFLIPYLILLVLEGMPLLLLEFGIGQRLRKGSVGVWRSINPYLTGIGFVPECEQSSTVDYFLYRVTLNSTTSIADSGGINWPIVLCLLTAWTIVAICCIRGISTAGKAVYVTAILPYIVLGIFLIRGLTLKGAMSGLKFLFTPDVNELIKPSTWLDAGAQVFYAFGLGWGGLISFSSYNPVHNNCVQDAVILSVVTSLTSVYAAAVTYSIIGFRATEKYDTCITVTIVSVRLWTFESRKGVEGTGLAFIVFTEAITQMPGSPAWSVLFFVMLFSLGLSTLFGNIEGVVVPLKDLNVFPKNWPHEVLTGLTCAIAFIICLLFAQNSGLYWVTLFDNFAGSVPLLTIGLFEMIAVVYIYGIDSSVAMKLVLPNPGLDDRIPSYEDLERMDKEEAGDRPKWDNKAQYILTCVGFCIGIGNVWRFPYLCQSHGGGAFLIPYLILLVLEGMPLLLLEFGIGQRLRKGSVGVWRSINPYLTGIGFVPECEQSSTVDYYYYRAVYVTAILPYIVLGIFLIRGLTLKGSLNGVNNNCVQDAVILSAITGFTSVYAATVTYTILASEQQRNMTSVSGVEGTGLAFIVFTEAITQMPGSPVWSVLFFVMLLCLGISTLFGNIEGVVVPLKDLNIIPKNWPQEAVTGVTCFVGFIICLLFAQHSGIYWVTLFDNFAGSVPLLTIGLFEMISIVYIYGIDRFNEDLEFMVGHKPNIFWQISWRFVSPLVVLVILVFYLVTQVQKELTYLVWDVNSLRMGKTKDSEVEERPKWDNKFQYLLTPSYLALIVQYLSSGAFLIPYLIALVFQGLPLLYLELAIGQRLRMGSIGVWNSISPMLGGVGIASMIVSFLVGIFYNTILAWVLWYFFHSFQNPLPWSQCPVNANLTANYFWYRETLNITPDIETSGSLQWWLVLCLASAWCVVYICFIRGIKSIGKAVYVTATFPYLVLTIFLIRALTLPGSTDGLVYLFTPDWEILKNPQVWLDAATQIFFSLSVAFGGLIAFSSYNEERNNCERDAVVVGVINSATSLYASISIFAILGFKATNGFNSCRNENIVSLTNHFEFSDQNITLENYDDWFQYLNRTSPDDLASLNLKHCDLQIFLDESASGTGLAFIVITEAVIEMPGSQIWAILFFVMLFSLGLSSMFGTIEGVLTPINELKLIIAVAYGRGMKTFSEDIYFMTGKRPNIFWKACWMLISPLMLLVVLVAYVAIQAQTHPSYPSWDPDYELFPQTKMLKYPDWVFAIIILLCVLPVISIPVVALYKLICCRIKKCSARGEPNAYCNDGFEVETREPKSQTP